jgi:glucose-1-phosphate thymidylyltransferase
VVTDSLIGPHSSIGAECRIANSAVEHSVVLERSSIENVARMEDSLIGREVRINGGAGRHGAIRVLLSDMSELDI